MCFVWNAGNSNATKNQEISEEAQDHRDVMNHIVRIETINTTQIDDMDNHKDTKMTTEETGTTTVETGKFNTQMPIILIQTHMLIHHF